jgi:hypothetical protein
VGREGGAFHPPAFVLLAVDGNQGAQVDARAGDDTIGFGVGIVGPVSGTELTTRAPVFPFRHVRIHS